ASIVSLYGSAPSYFSVGAFSAGPCFGSPVTGKLLNQTERSQLSLCNLAAHPRGERRRVVNDHIPLPVFERVEITVAIADKLLNIRRQFAGMRLPAIEIRHLVPTTQRIFYLIRTSKPGAAEYENAHWCRPLLCK